MLATEITSNSFSISRDGLGKIVQGEAEINQAIYNILMTTKGSDPLRPDFGCDSITNIDKPLNKIKAIMVKNIIEAISLYETRVILTSVVPQNTASGNLIFNIKYTIKNSVNTGQTDITYGV